MRHPSQSNMIVKKPVLGNSYLTIAVLCGLALLAMFWARMHQAEPTAPVDTNTDTESTAEVQEAATPAPRTLPNLLEQRWGIQVSGVHLAVGGALLDFRYKVLDPAKAAVMLKQESESTYLVDEAANAKLLLGNASRSHSLLRDAKELFGGHSYSMHFPNPGKRFHPGSKVTLVMGNFRAEHLTIE